MAAGRLGAVTLTAATNSTVYTAPDTVYYSEVDIALLNPGAADATIELAVSKSATPGDADYIEKGAIVFKAGGVIVRAGVKLSPGEMVVAKSNQAGVVVRVSGVEKTTTTQR